MAQTINLTSALTALSRMMGKRKLPQGDTSDWKDYVQFAFDYAWRYYKWDWSLRYVTIDMTNDPYLPVDFDIGGYREAIPPLGSRLSETSLKQYVQYGGNTAYFALQYDSVANRYKVLAPAGTGNIQMIYQVTPPTLGDANVPFPSAMTIGIGASIWAKQGENPTRADIDQEWDEFHAELDRHVGRADKNVPRQRATNLYEAYGTYPGDSRY